MLIEATLTGEEGVMMLTHNERLANKMDPITKELAAISAKRKKTEDDLTEMARLEFYGGLYLGDDGLIGIPAWNVLRSLQDGAKITRQGKTIERGLRMASADIVPINHSGSRDPETLWNAGGYDQRSVKVTTSKITRTRPKFTNWEVVVQFVMDPEVLDFGSLVDIADTAGQVAGLGDYRPRYGRYTASVVKL